MDKFDQLVAGRTIERLALAQHAVFASWQEGASVLDRRSLAARVERQRLFRVYTGVYGLVPEPLLTNHGRRMAAVLACGPEAFLSHYAAIKLHGLMDSSRSRIDVTVRSRTGRSRKGIRIHRSTTLRPQDVTRVDGIPCTTLARTIFDLAEELSERQLERLLDEAAYQEVLDTAALDEQIAHNAARRRTCTKLNRALAGHRPGSTRTDGPLGEEMLALIATTELPPPKVQHWIDLHDGEPMIQADFAWPQARVILETDGQQAHGKPRRTQSDYRRDQRAALAGWHTIRVTRRDIRSEPERIKRTLTALIRSRLARQAARRPARPPGGPRDAPD